MTATSRGDESGMALMTTMMVMLLMSGLMVAFFAAVMADQRANGIDRDQTQAYAAAQAGLEKLSSDLATTFETDFNPTAVQINALTTHPPVIPGFSYIAPGGAAGSGYAITFTTDAHGNPAPMSNTGTPITSGAYQGFTGIITQYTITTTARSTGNAEVRLRRVLETVAVPVFQFGVFGNTDLSFFAGPDFDFGGRIQTNGNLYLAQSNGNTLTLEDKTMAAGDVIRTQLSNGWLTSTNYTGTVNMETSPGVYRALARNEGSLVGGPGTAVNEMPVMNPGWTSLSIGTYAGNIENGKTGAKVLNLPLVSQGALPIDLIKRPLAGEDVSNPLVYTQRFYTMASLRILLSDNPGEITNLPGVTATPPVPLDQTLVTGAQYGPVSATKPPLAEAPGPLPTAMAFTAASVAGDTTLSVSNITANFPAQQITIGGVNYSCTGRDLTHFYGCTNPLPVVGTGTAVTGPVTAAGQLSGLAATASTTITTAITSTTKTQDKLTVASTAGFGPALPLAWVNLGAGIQPQFITCTGADPAAAGTSPNWWLLAPVQFNGCLGLNVAAPVGAQLSTNSLATAGQPLLNGFIKIEMENAANVWTDVTTEILNLGIAAKSQWPIGSPCADPTPNAVIRLQRLRDSGDGNCYYLHSQSPYDYWPNVLYDTREGNLRDTYAVADETMSLLGGMYYVTLDVNNLRRWLTGVIGVSGTNAQNNNGFIVYFSDRRNNVCPAGAAAPCPAAGGETGELGFEDVVNPATAAGTPDGVLQTGEDVNANGVIDTYGQTPQNVPPGAALPLLGGAGNALIYKTAVGGVPVTAATFMVNRPIFFRRALKLVNGAINAGVASLPAGLTVATENPLYIQGDYNAAPAAAIAGNAAGHVAASVLADSVTVLSSAWLDVQSFYNPNDPSTRQGTATAYRMAVAAGKGLSFPQPTGWGAVQDFGTDGGVHNFLRYLEGWGGNNLYYRGSIVNLFNSRQSVGTYKCCINVYIPPTRVYNFDSDFLLPSLLPPGTPMFRDVDTLTFRQLLRPNQ